MIEHRAQHPLPHWGLPQCHWKELRQQEGPPPHSWWLKLKSIFFLLVQSGKENHGCVSVRCFLTQGSIHSLGRRSICQLFNSQYLMATVVHKAEAAQGSSGEETEVICQQVASHRLAQTYKAQHAHVSKRVPGMHPFMVPYAHAA